MILNFLNKQKKKSKIFLLFFFLFFLIFSGFNKIQAQSQTIDDLDKENQSAISVGPAILEEILTPGEEHQARVVLTNITNFPLPIKSIVKDFLPKEEIPFDKRNIFDASSWIRIEPIDFILQPKEQKEVEIFITAPIESSPGGHYATAYFEPLVPVVALSPQTTYSIARVGVLMFLVVKGDIVETASVGVIRGSAFHQSGPIKLTISFKNEGNVHLLPSGEVSIIDWRGNQIATLVSRPLLVLPDTSRDLVFTWDKKYPFGRFIAKPKVIFGSEQVKNSSHQFVFWVIPIWPILLPILLLTTLFILIILKRGRFVLALKVLFGKNKNINEILKKKGGE